MAVIKIKEWLFEKINKMSIDEIFPPEYFEAFDVMETIAKEQNVAFILDCQGAQKISMERFREVLSKFPSKYIKKIPEYEFILFLNGIYGKGELDQEA